LSIIPTLYPTNHLDEIDKIDEIILSYTTKTNTFSLFRWSAHVTRSVKWELDEHWYQNIIFWK